MEIIRFSAEALPCLESYLRNQYLRNQNTVSWLPERLHDMCFRIRAQEADRRTAMLHGAVLRCKEKGIEKCYVDSFGRSRRQFYQAAGFAAEDTTEFWYKTFE